MSRFQISDQKTCAVCAATERETLDDTDSQERAGKAGTQDRHAQK